MKTYITYFGQNGKTATMANNKKEASKQLGVSITRVLISNVNIDYVQGATRV